MKLKQLFIKLQKKDKENVHQFEFCITLAILLISAYILLICSPLVQETFLDGGDSEMQIFAAFFLAAIGCSVFVLYATSLFLRYKSREIGVFLVLGAKKRQMTSALVKEIMQMFGLCSIGGVAGGVLVAKVSGMIFDLLAKKVAVNHFAVTGEGLLFSLVYILILLSLIAWQVRRSMKRTNLMDILHEEEKHEPLKQAPTKKYLLSGIVLLITGAFVGYVFPQLYGHIFHRLLGSWTSWFYLLAFVGLYRILVYVVSGGVKGRNPQKYYHNLLANSLMKFQGKSMVRNMLVVTLILLSGLMAVSFIPMNLGSAIDTFRSYETQYGYRYFDDAKEVTLQDVKKLAAHYEVGLKNCRKAQLLYVVGDGKDRDESKAVYKKKYKMVECINVSAFNRITGKHLKLVQGYYRILAAPNSHETIFNHFDDLTKLYKADDTVIQMRYKGKTTYQSLVTDEGFDSNARFVLSDVDFKQLEKDLPANQKLTQILFDAKGKKKLDFSRELYRRFTNQMSDDMKVAAGYDRYEAQQAGKKYDILGWQTYDANHPEKLTDWKYVPTFVPLQEHYLFLTYSVYLLMFIFVAVICLAASGVISYTRAQSLALQSRQTFSELKKLGCTNCQLEEILNKLLRKVFAWPTILGCSGSFGIVFLMLWQNDGRLDFSELKSIPMILCLIGAAALCQYFVYRKAKNKTKQIAITENC